MLDQTGRPLSLEQLQNFANMPEGVQIIRRKNWNELFKSRVEKVYLELHNIGIEMDIHAIGRFGQRMPHIKLEEIKDLLISNPEPNYYDTETDRDVWFFPEKTLAVVKSKIDNKIVTFMNRKLAADKWKKAK